MKARAKRLTALFLITSICIGTIATDVRKNTVIFAEETVQEEIPINLVLTEESTEGAGIAKDCEEKSEEEVEKEPEEELEKGMEKESEEEPEEELEKEPEESLEGEAAADEEKKEPEENTELDAVEESDDEKESEENTESKEEIIKGDEGEQKREEGAESDTDVVEEDEKGQQEHEEQEQEQKENSKSETETDITEETTEQTTEELEIEEEVVEEVVEEVKEPVIITDIYGEQFPIDAIEVPSQLTVTEQTYPVDYAQGVYRVYVPEGTESLVIVVPDQGEDENVSILKWNGYVTEQEETWKLYPDVSWFGDYTAEGNIYTVALKQYALDKENLTKEQYALYGEVEEDLNYAEIFVYGEKRAELLLVEYVPDFTQVSELSASKTEIKDAYTSTGKNLAQSAETYIPTVSSINGEWQILGLARSGANVKKNVYDEYVNNLLNILKENGGVLHKKKYTEYSRVILALTALGYDVTNVGGYNLLQPLADYEQTVWQGVNGAAFALIAFDSHNYEIPKAEEGKTQNSREKLIETMLGQEISGGGWALSGKNPDPDMTAMVMQALAPYYDTNPEVKSAVDRGIAKLSSMQKEDGSYATYGTKTSESCSQVVVALTALGINPNTDSRFTKNGISVLEALIAFQMPDGSFRHVMSGGSDQMATEQAYYALTAYERFSNGKTSLYNMNDVVLPSDEKKAAEVKKLIKALPEVVKLSNKTKIEKAWNAYNALNETQKGLITKEELKKLQAAVEALKKLDSNWNEEESDKTPETGKDDAEKPEIGKDDAEKPETGKDDTEKPETGKDDEEKPETGKDDEEKPETGKDDTEKPGTGKDDEEKPETDVDSDKVAGGTTKQVDLVSGSTVRTETVVKIPKKQTEKAEQEEVNEKEKIEEKTLKKKTEKKDEEVKKILQKLKAMFGTVRSENKLPDDIKDYTEKQIDSVLEIYRLYMELSTKQKAELERETYYKNYLEVLEKIRTEYHYDAVTGTDLLENEEDMLPWYVKMKVVQREIQQEEAASVRAVMNGQGELLTLFDISLENIVEKESWQPEDILRVSIPLIDMKEYEKAAIVHLRDDGSLEFLTAYIAGTKLEFDTDHFSCFGVVGYNGSMAELMQEQQKENNWIYLAPGVGAALLLVLIKRSLGTNKKKDVKRSEG